MKNSDERDGGAAPTTSPGSTFQDGLLLFGGADEPADAFDDLALGVHLLLLQFLSQEDGGNWRKKDRASKFRTKSITSSRDSYSTPPTTDLSCSSPW